MRNPHTAQTNHLNFHLFTVDLTPACEYRGTIVRAEVIEVTLFSTAPLPTTTNSSVDEPYGYVKTLQLVPENPGTSQVNPQCLSET